MDQLAAPDVVKPKRREIIFRPQQGPVELRSKILKICRIISTPFSNIYKTNLPYFPVLRKPFSHLIPQPVGFTEGPQHRIQSAGAGLCRPNKCCEFAAAFRKNTAFCGRTGASAPTHPLIGQMKEEAINANTVFPRFAEFPSCRLAFDGGIDYNEY